MTDWTRCERAALGAPQRDRSPLAGCTIHRATRDETAIIARHRRSMFEEFGSAQNLDLVAQRRRAPPRLATLPARPARWARLHLQRLRRPGPPPARPRPGDPPEALHQWARDRGPGAIALHASGDSRPLYEALGYLPTSEMRIDFPAIARGEWPAAV